MIKKIVFDGQQCEIKVCDLQEICSKYETGDNRPPNEHVRSGVPCKKYLQSDCDMYLYWMNWQGIPIACSINKQPNKRATE
jgi:hypothetical protein